MPLKLTFKDINDEKFMGAVNRLSQIDLPVKESYNLSKLLRLLQKHLVEGREEYSKILKRFADLDEKGQFKPRLTVEKKNEKGEIIEPARPLPGTFVIGEQNKEGFEKAVKDFLSMEVNIEVHKLNLGSLGDVKIDAETLAHAEPIICSIGSV